MSGRSSGSRYCALTHAALTKARSEATPGPPRSFRAQYTPLRRGVLYCDISAITLCSGGSAVSYPRTGTYLEVAPGVELYYEEYGDGGHLMFWEHPERFNATLREFVAQL